MTAETLPYRYVSVSLWLKVLPEHLHKGIATKQTSSLMIITMSSNSVKLNSLPKGLALIYWGIISATKGGAHIWNVLKLCYQLRMSRDGLWERSFGFLSPFSLGDPPMRKACLPRHQDSTGTPPFPWDPRELLALFKSSWRFSRIVPIAVGALLFLYFQEPQGPQR